MFLSLDVNGSVVDSALKKALKQQQKEEERKLKEEEKKKKVGSPVGCLRKCSVIP